MNEQSQEHFHTYTKQAESFLPVSIVVRIVQTCIQ